MAYADHLTARFCYDDYTDEDADDAECVPEPDGEVDAASWAELMGANETDFGAVVISYGDVDMRIEDSLTPMMSFLMGAVPDLVDRKHVVIRYFESYGYLRLDPEGKDILVTGDFVARALLPRAELIPALLGVGERYTKLLAAVRGDDPDTAASLADLEAKRQAGQAALDRWDGT